MTTEFRPGTESAATQDEQIDTNINHQTKNEVFPTASPIGTAAPKAKMTNQNENGKNGTLNGESAGNFEERGSGTTEQRRRELADFLRTRREKLKPEQMGLAQGARRRTPGLRREEVAELAGVGTTWYTWLEQARDIQPSAEVLRRLGRALQLTPAEMRHMFTLAGKAAPTDLEPANEIVSESLARVLNEAILVPALLVGSRWDALQINKAAMPIFEELMKLEPAKRNYVYYVFCTPNLRTQLRNWEVHARRLLAEFRASVSDSLDNPWIREMVDLIKSESKEFDAWWKEHDVRDESAARVEVGMPDGTVQTLCRTVLRPTENQRFKIVLFTPLASAKIND